MSISPLNTIGSFANRFVGRLRCELDTLHRAGQERDFLATEKGMGYRTHVRHETACPGTFSSKDQAVDCVVLNVSVGSAKLRLNGKIDVTAQVKLRVEQVGEFPGRVIWRNDATLGIEFNEPLRDIDRVAAAMRLRSR